MSFKLGIKDLSIACTLSVTDSDKKMVASVNHKLLEASQTLSMMLEDITGGYRFDDNEAKEKIAAISAAVEVANKAIGFIVNSLRQEMEASP